MALLERNSRTISAPHFPLEFFYGDYPVRGVGSGVQANAG
jgi:hypothetical protein